MASIRSAAVRPWRRAALGLVALSAAAGLVLGDVSPAAASARQASPRVTRVEITGFLRDRHGDIRRIAAPQAEGSLTSNGQEVSGTGASGMNDHGQIVGSYVAGGTRHGFLLDDGEYRTIDVPGAISTAVNDINNRGEIVGIYTDRHGKGRGFVRSRRGRFTTISVPGSFSTGPHRINDRGQVAGVYSDVDNAGQPVRTGHGFIWDHGRFTRFDAPGNGPLTDPAGIDNRGTVVGAYDDADGVTHGFLRTRRGRFVTIDLPGAVFTSPVSINDRGDIVGQTGTADELAALAAHGFLLRRGRLDADATTLIDVPDFPLVAAADIDSRGRIVGYAYRAS